jgi:two-component system, chemotaxis family, protein-glutamate methylesterase/glutaminase
LHNRVESLQQQLQSVMQAWPTQQRPEEVVGSVPTEPPPPVPPAPLSGADEIVRRMQALQSQAPIEIVAIGVSTGGPQALTEVIPHLPADLGVPVVIVQHMPQTFTRALAASLNDKSALTVVEGQHGQTLEAGMVYIAPGGKQMKIIQQSQRQAPSLFMTDDPPENYCKPSVDYLFRSVAHLYAKRALGVIMTGMGSDGVLGLRMMKQQGAKILAQDAESCVVFGMPMEAIKAGVVDAVVPLGQLATAIIQHIGRR